MKDSRYLYCISFHLDNNLISRNIDKSNFVKKILNGTIIIAEMLILTKSMDYIINQSNANN